MFFVQDTTVLFKQNYYTNHTNKLKIALKRKNLVMQNLLFFTDVATVFKLCSNLNSKYLNASICTNCSSNFRFNLQLIVGISVPINMQGRVLSYAHNFQFQYPLPPNGSLFSSTQRRRRSVMSGDRSLVYRLLEHEWQR